MNNNSPTFGNILLRERTNRKLSLIELADYIGKDDKGKHLISASYLNRLEKNEADNPSFKNICQMIKILYLDLYEVFKSFGFEELIFKDDRLNIDKIEDIIRTVDINAPLSKKHDYISRWELLDFQEKEILISILSTIFDIGINDNNYVLECLFDIVRDIYKYRNLRKEKVSNYIKDKGLTNYVNKESLECEELKVIPFDGYNEMFINGELTDDDIDELINYVCNSSYGIIDGNFKVENKERRLLFEIKKFNNTIEIINIEVIL